MRSGPAVVATLAAYGARQATTEQVIRAMIEHPTWLTPLTLFVSGPGPVTVPSLVLFGDVSRMPPGATWFFTDRARAESANSQLVAQGGQLGPYASDVPGVDLFEKLAMRKLDKINVNIGSPVAETFTFPGEFGAVLALWAQAIALERRLAASTSFAEPELVHALKQFPGFCAFTTQGGLLQLETSGTTVVPIFTAVDCATEFAARLPAAIREDVSRVTLGGEELFRRLAALEGTTILVNPVGPGFRCTLPASAAAAVVS